MAAALLAACLKGMWIPLLALPDHLIKSLQLLMQITLLLLVRRREVSK